MLVSTRTHSSLYFKHIRRTSCDTFTQTSCDTYCWKIAVDWHTPTAGMEPTAPPPRRSAVRHTNHCATAPFPKKNGLDAAYIMRRLPRYGSLARCYHCHRPTLLPLKTTFCSCSRAACIYNRLETPT